MIIENIKNKNELTFQIFKNAKSFGQQKKRTVLSQKEAHSNIQGPQVPLSEQRVKLNQPPKFANWQDIIDQGAAQMKNHYLNTSRGVGEDVINRSDNSIQIENHSRNYRSKSEF